MAQHYETKNFSQQYFRKIESSIANKFEKNFNRVGHSFYYEEIKDPYPSFSENENVLVFKNYRKVNNEMTQFEIHFDQAKNKVLKIYLVE